MSNLQSGVGRVDEENFQVKNGNGALYAVVHQYDRNKKLANFYIDKFAYWERKGGMEHCERYEISSGMDLLKGSCDYRVAGGIDAGMCCRLCDMDTDCKGFTHYGTACFLKSCQGPVQRRAIQGATTGILKR